MTKIKKGFSYDEINLKFLEEFNSCIGENKDNGKINEIVFTFRNMLQYTKKELINKYTFTEQECQLLCESIEGHIYTPSISAKSFILSKIKDSILFEKLNNKYQISSDQLISKFESLTEFQAYTILNMVFEYLGDKNKDIKNIFLIC